MMTELAKESFTREQLHAIKVALTDNRPYADRISLGFAVRLLELRNGLREQSIVLDELDCLEGLGPQTPTKPAEQFHHPPLYPLWHKHLSAPRHWAVIGKTVIHLPSRGYRLLDVGHTFVSVVNHSVSPNGALNPVFGKPAFMIDATHIPNWLFPELKMNATYEIHIRVYADNAAPAECSCRIKVGTTFSDLGLEPCADPRPRDHR